MKAPGTKRAGAADAAPSEGQGEQGLELSWEGTSGAAAPGVASEQWRASLWDALAGWGYSEPTRSVVPETTGRWLLDDEDFSSEHGYEPGFEGRSEFEHGEFDRWL